MPLIKNALRVGSITFLSRIFGYIRDVIIASYIETSLINDAFIIAFRLPNLFRTIFGEGAFNSAFVPIFSSLVAKRGEKFAKKFAAKVQTILVCLLIVFSIVIIFFMEKIIYITAPGFTNDPQSLQFITKHAQITFFVSLVAFYGGLLNSKHYYLVFVAVPIIMNIVLIIAVFINNDASTIAITLSYGVLIAGIFEVLWMLYFLHKLDLNIGFGWPNKDQNVKKLFINIGPAILGSGAAQINVWVSTILASFIPGGISYLYYADRIYQIPLALVGISIGTILLPVLSTNFSRRNFRIANIHLNNAIEFSMVLSIPASIAIFIMSADFVKILFEYGEYNSNSTNQTASALSIFGIGIPAYILNKIFCSAFYANQDTKTPVQIAAIALCINLLISYLLLDRLGHLSIALGSIVSAWFNIIVLYKILRHRNYLRPITLALYKIIKSMVCALLMGIILIVINFLIKNQNFLMCVIFKVLMGGISYISAIILTKTYSYKSMKKILMKPNKIN